MVLGIGNQPMLPCSVETAVPLAEHGTSFDPVSFHRDEAPQE
jgi:hypothetical protein